MNVFEQLYTAYKLKGIKRFGTVEDRFESTAEHIYSSLMLAQFFMKKIENLDEKKVTRMILYHDLVEIHAGDTFILSDKERKDKTKRENLALKKLTGELPEELGSDLKKYWGEFEENSSLEAKFCQAIDALDPILHSMAKPDEWSKHGFTETNLREKKEHYFKEFPVMLDFFNELIKHLKKNKIMPT